MSSIAQDKEQLLQLEKEAEELHLHARDLNKQEKFDEAKQLYNRYKELDKEAINLALKLAEQRPLDASSKASPMLFEPLAETNSVTAKLQACVIASIVADAASTGVQWVYDPEARQNIIDGAANKGLAGIEFHDPCQCPFFTYEVGRNSPYGEQMLVLLENMGKVKKLDLSEYGRALVQFFGSSFDGYRDASTKGFLRRYALDYDVAVCGADDDQANSCTRLSPILAAFFSEANSSNITSAVQLAGRVTQNSNLAIAWGIVFSHLLVGLIQTPESEDIFLNVVQQALSKVQEDTSKMSLEEDVKSLVPDIVAKLQYAIDHHKTSVKDFIDDVGRSCAQPNSLQTPLQVALSVLEGKSLTSMDRNQAEYAFVSACRTAMENGGCCSSRCNIIGQLMGAWLGAKFGLDFIPSTWKEKTLKFQSGLDAVNSILASRS